MLTPSETGRGRSSLRLILRLGKSRFRDQPILAQGSNWEEVSPIHPRICQLLSETSKIGTTADGHFCHLDDRKPIFFLKQLKAKYFDNKILCPQGSPSHRSTYICTVTLLNPGILPKAALRTILLVSPMEISGSHYLLRFFDNFYEECCGQTKVGPEYWDYVNGTL